MIARLTTTLIALTLTACAGPPAITQGEASYSSSVPLTTFSDYHIVKTGEGQAAPKSVSLDKLAADLARYDVIFIGEAHGHVGNHTAQADILAALHSVYPDLTLSMEQFDRPHQAVMDSYLAGEIGEETLIYEAQAWEGYTQSYRPLIEFAKVKGLPVIAANTPTTIVRCIGERGPEFINALPAPDKDWIAGPLDLSDGPYKDKFVAFMSGGHHGADTDPEQMNKTYAAQIARDQTMAQSIARQLTQNPGRKIVHVNGSFHSAGLLGTPKRVASYKPGVKMVNLHPVLVDNADQPSFTAQDAASGDYLILLQNTPKRFVKMENINAFIARSADTIKQERCAY